MRSGILTLVSFLLCLNASKAQDYDADSLFIRKIFDAALTESICYDVLEHLCTKIGPRLSGSKGAADAVVYTRGVMEKEGFDKVFLQEAMVPHWERGDVEKAAIISRGQQTPLSICALGGSVATPAGGVRGKVVEVKNFEELDKLGRAGIEGKIVFFSRPMEPRHIHTFEAYGGCVNQRHAGASKASRYGAKAVLVRSMTLIEDDYPHTGGVGYDTLYPKIPAVAVSTKGAGELSRMLKKDPNLELTYTISSRWLPDTLSHNVIGEIAGSEFPEEYIICGGHLDAWDNGQGAHDDGAGCVQSIEALRILKNLGYRPRHSLRAVMFMNEENGARGARAYADSARSKKEVHRIAIESDRGGFTPRGFSIDHQADTVAQFARFKKWLAPYGIHDFKQGGSGVDVGFLRNQGVICMGYIPDSQRYFDYHHAGSDTFDKVNKRELELGAASMAALIYLADKYRGKTIP